MLLRAREADQALRKERAASLAERADRVRKLRSQLGWACYHLGAVSLALLFVPQSFLFQWGLGVSVGLTLLYLLLDHYLRRLERERDFYGWIPDTRVIPPDWKQM